MPKSKRIMKLLADAKEIAREYRDLTGRPLGITGEVAEFEAARLLKLNLTPARNAGHDAVRKRDGRKFQIKGRCVIDGTKKSQRMGRIKIADDFDAVLLVMLDADYNATEILEAERGIVMAALHAPGSKARNERGQLGVPKFRAIGRSLWKRVAAHGG